MPDWSGVQYIKIDGTDRKSVIQNCTIQGDQTGSTCALTMVYRTSYTLPFTVFGKRVIVKNDDNVIPFYGEIVDVQIQDDLKLKTYTLIAHDMTKIYANKSIAMKFRPGTTVSQALASLVTGYTSDLIGTDETDQLTECELALGAMSLSAGIQAVLSLLEESCLWSIAYNEGTGELTHHFKLKATTSIGTIDDGALVYTGSFAPNYTNLKNIITVEVKDMPSDTLHEQYYYFEKESAITNYNQSYETRLPIYLDIEPMDIMVYLLVGNWSSDVADLKKAGKWELGTKEIDEKSKEIMGFQIQKHLGTSGYQIPSGVVGEGVYTSATLAKLANSPFYADQGEYVKRKIIGMYDEDFACYVQADPIDGVVESEYGVVYVPTLRSLKDGIEGLRKHLGYNVQAEQLLGYLITTHYTKDVAQEFRDETSISTYGERMSQGKFTINTKSMKMFRQWGMAKVAELSVLKYQGEIEYRLYSMDTKIASLYPSVGDLVTLDHPYRGTVSDVEISSWTLTIRPTTQDVKIACQQDSSLGLFTRMVQMFTNQMRYSSDIATKDVKMFVTADDSMTLDMDTATVTTHTWDESTIAVDGMDLERLWLV